MTPKGPPPDASLRDTLGRAARAAPSGGRAKWMVWAAVGGIVFVLGVLQMLGVLKNPTAERIRELHEQQDREKRAKESAPPAPPPAPADQGTTK